jgi:hypothetical protein
MGATRFGPASTPPALDNLGRTAGFALDSIRQLQPMGAVAFHFTLTPSGTIALTLPWARDEILGRPTLGPAQLAYLDSLGNGNGGYDVGDFLAYYRSQSAAARRLAP